MAPDTVTIDYTNWRGTRRVRPIIPQRLVWSSNQYHPKPQWLLVATDVDDGSEKTFALDGIHSWNGVEITPCTCDQT